MSLLRFVPPIAFPFLLPSLALAHETDIFSPTGTLSFFPLGVEHVLTGFDHLLFLLALLIGVRGIGPVVKIVTTFTVAHSLTLVAATQGWVFLPAGIVEPIIAGSIVVVAATDLLARREPDLRIRLGLTFLFGLVHGLGFAGVLSELLVGEVEGGARGAALLLFNLGVEAGQLGVVCVAFPAMKLLARKEMALVVGRAAVGVGGLWFLGQVI